MHRPYLRGRRQRHGLTARANGTKEEGGPLAFDGLSPIARGALRAPVALWAYGQGEPLSASPGADGMRAGRPSTANGTPPFSVHLSALRVSVV
jgi:hypothetical protein